MPTRHPRKMVTLTPQRAEMIDEITALEGIAPDLGSLVEDGARARLERLHSDGRETQRARRRLADRVLGRDLGQDADAADAVKRLGLDR